MNVDFTREDLEALTIAVLLASNSADHEPAPIPESVIDSLLVKIQDAIDAFAQGF